MNSHNVSFLFIFGKDPVCCFLLWENIKIEFMHTQEVNSIFKVIIAEDETKHRISFAYE